GAAGRHLVEAGDLAELALEGRGDARGHHLRARPRVERQHLDRRVVDLRQGRDRQLRGAREAREQQPDHQQRRRDQPQDEEPRRAHLRWPPLRVPPLPRSTFVPSSSLSCPSTTTFSPACTPDERPASVPSLSATWTGRACATASSPTMNTNGP